MSTLLVCGSRRFQHVTRIHGVMADVCAQWEVTLVVHGAARGADMIADGAARRLGIRVWSFPASWATYGKRAGPIRNSEMLKKGKPDYVLAFSDSFLDSRGTSDMVRKALDAGVRSFLCSSAFGPTELIAERMHAASGANCAFRCTRWCGVCADYENERIINAVARCSAGLYPAQKGNEE